MSLPWRELWGDRTHEQAREWLLACQPGTLLAWDTHSLRNGLAMVVARTGGEMTVLFDGRRREVRTYDLDGRYDERERFNVAACGPLLLPGGGPP